MRPKPGQRATAKGMRKLTSAVIAGSFQAATNFQLGVNSTGTTLSRNVEPSVPAGFWALMGAESPSATYAFDEVAWNDGTSSFDVVVSGRTGIAPEANDVIGLTGKYGWIPDLGGDYVWVWHRHTCRPCALPTNDMLATLSYYSNFIIDPPVLATLSLAMTYLTGTDTLIALAGTTGAPHAQGGRVWRSECFRLRSVGNRSISGDKVTPCGLVVDPYFGPLYYLNLNTFYDFQVEFFCDGGREQVMLYQFVHAGLGGTVDDPTCHDPDMSCSGFGIVWGSGGWYSQATGIWYPGSTAHRPFYGLETASVVCDPLHVNYIRDSSFFFEDKFNEILITNPP